jgi:hypothetical protein
MNETYSPDISIAQNQSLVFTAAQINVRAISLNDKPHPSPS